MAGLCDRLLERDLELELHDAPPSAAGGVRAFVSAPRALAAAARRSSVSYGRLVAAMRRARPPGLRFRVPCFPGCPGEESFFAAMARERADLMAARYPEKGFARDDFEAYADAMLAEAERRPPFPAAYPWIPLLERPGFARALAIRAYEARGLGTVLRLFDAVLGGDAAGGAPRLKTDRDRRARDGAALDVYRWLLQRAAAAPDLALQAVGDSAEFCERLFAFRDEVGESELAFFARVLAHPGAAPALEARGAHARCQFVLFAMYVTEAVVSGDGAAPGVVDLLLRMPHRPDGGGSALLVTEMNAAYKLLSLGALTEAQYVACLCGIMDAYRDTHPWVRHVHSLEGGALVRRGLHESAINLALALGPARPPRENVLLP